MNTPRFAAAPGRTAAAADAAAPALALWRAALRHAVRGWRWRDTALGVLVGTLCLLYMGSPLLPGTRLVSNLSPLAYNILQFGLPIVFAVKLADAAVDLGARAASTYGGAVLAVTVGGVWGIGPLLSPWLGSDPRWTIASDFWLALGVGVILSLGVGGYAQWRASQRALALRLAGETNRLRLQHQLQAARLLAVQARVEPELLFGGLRQVRQALLDDRPDAVARLDDLIDLLRLLLPRAGASASTLRREIDLVAARGRVGGEAAYQPGSVAWTIPPALADAPLAPLVLSELLRALPSWAGPWKARVDAVDGDPDDRGWRLRFTPAAAFAVDDLPRLRQGLLDLPLPLLRQRLQDVHGPAAELLVDLDAQPPHLTLHLPDRHDLPSADR